MEIDGILSSFMIASFLVGIGGAGAMVGFSLIVGKLLDVSIVKAAGSVLSGDISHALKPGLAIHTVTGVFFGFVYVFGFVFLDPGNKGFLIPIGAMAGLLHGVMVSLLLVGSLGDNSELEYIKSKIFPLGFTTVGAHVVYGAVAGTVTWLLQDMLYWS